MQSAHLTRPIFFIGVPRSGTTIVFESVARHPDIGGPLTYHDNHPGWIPSGLLLRLADNRLVQFQGTKKQHGKVILGNRFLPQHAEAYRFWNHFARPDFAKSYLLNCTATDTERRRLRNVVQRLLWWEGRIRFATKLTGPGRIAYLGSVFPDALFVHLLRDGRAVTHSLLNVAFWREGGGLEQPWWRPGFCEHYVDYWQRQGASPHVLAALQWRNIIETTRAESTRLAPEQYMEIKYEDFVQDPHRTLADIFAFGGLSDSDRAHRYLANHAPSKTLNTKYEMMTADEVQEMTDAMAPCLEECGYL